MELQLARMLDLMHQQQRILLRVGRALSAVAAGLNARMQDVDWACKALLEVFEDYDERDGLKLHDGVRQSYWQWCSARQLEGYSRAAQRRSWRLLCLDVALENKVDITFERMAWVEVVKRDQEKSREEKQLNLESFHLEDSINMRMMRSLQRTDVQFWEPALAADVQAVQQPVIVAAMQARIQHRHEQMHLMQRQWGTDVQEFVGLEFHCLQDDVPEYKLWMERQVC